MSDAGAAMIDRLIELRPDTRDDLADYFWGFSYD